MRTERSRRAITILEVLIAMTISLIVLYAMMWQFNVRMEQVREGRASVELLAQLRGAAQLLHQDLRRCTRQAIPWATSSSGEGYLELVEGPQWDFKWLQENANLGMFGDFDDVLAFTIRSEGEPFTGFLNGQEIKSHYAEVIWWTVWRNKNGDTDPQPDEADPQPGEIEIALYRRQFLVRPDLDLDRLLGSRVNVKDFYDNSDISVRIEGYDAATNTAHLVANSLADLARRENRFCHTAGFPHEISRSKLKEMVKRGDRAGEYLILRNVLAFDMKVYDPDVPVVMSASGELASGELLTPNDPAWGDALNVALQPNSPSPPLGYGEFVDMFFLRAFPGVSWPPNVRIPTFSQGPLPPVTVPTYDTWCFDYEQDGVNQNGNSKTDEGTNGLDDNGQWGVDDPLERETQPPYPVPLRGVKVILRVIDPASRTVRQMSVVQDFVPY